MDPRAMTEDLGQRDPRDMIEEVGQRDPRSMTMTSRQTRGSGSTRVRSTGRFHSGDTSLEARPWRCEQGSAARAKSSMPTTGAS